MNLFKKYWPFIKQDWLPILYFSIIQTWWYFETPFFKRLGSFLGPVVGISANVMCIAIYLSIISNPAKYAAASKLEHVDAPQWFKDALQISGIVMFNLVFFFVWYIDLYGMSNWHYAFCYGNAILAFLFIARVINRQQESESV